MKNALYIANSLPNMDTHRCFLLWGRRRLKASSARVSKLATPKKITPLYRRSLRTWFDYKKPGADRLPKKTHFRESNLQNASNIKKTFLHLITTQNTDLSIELELHRTA